MIQRDTFVSETILHVRGAVQYTFGVLNECNFSEEVRYFEKPGMLRIVLTGVNLRTTKGG
jgi:hypothetical protein